MKSSHVLTTIGVALALIVILFPVMMTVFMPSDHGIVGGSGGASSAQIVIQTVAWSVGVGLLATCIGWPVGIRIASVTPALRNGIVACLLMTLAVPAYAVFYVWWQVWPSGTWLHAYLVEHGFLSVAMKVCAVVALVGWSWPIAALIAMMATKTNNTLLLLHRLDGLAMHAKCIQHFLVDWRLIISSVLLVTAITAANTTCFDLAQITTIGNELRAIVAYGGSIFEAPLLSFVGLGIAIVASIIVFCYVPKGNRRWNDHPRSATPIVVVWIILSGGPLLASAITSLRGGGFQLWEYYGGDLLMSATIGVSVALLCVVLLFTSAAMHLSTARSIRVLASILDFGWIICAFLPASVVSMVLTNAWHGAELEIVYRTPVILVIANLTRVGFIGSIAGRWVASCTNIKTLCTLDGVQTPCAFLTAIRPRLVAAGAAVIGITLAMSLGEVALTSQLSPPARYQPIAVALLNAMHYQRPEIVTSALCVIIVVAVLGGMLVAFTHRKLVMLMLLLLIPFACDGRDPNPISQAKIIGGAGLADGRFMTPRAIDANQGVMVIIDKSGRLQRFTLDGTFLSAWELQLSGVGFPTGVSIDDEGLIWVADTHEHRVLVFDQEGNELLKFGSYGVGDGEFLYPTDIAFGIFGEVFVSEYGGNDRINVFDRNGNFQRSFGHHGKDLEGFKRPQSIAIERTTGNLFITDSGNHRIVVRSPDGSVLDIISSVGRETGALLYPYGIAFITPDEFIVCEFGNNRLQKFSKNGVPMGTWGGAGDRAGLFKTPWGIAILPNGLIVVDTGNNRLQHLPDIMIHR